MTHPLTNTARYGKETLVVPCNNPNPPTWDTFRKIVGQLQTNSCMMDFEPEWANKELALYFLGAYSKLVRSLYLKNNSQMFLDLVLKDNLVPEALFGLSGTKIAQKVPVKVTITKAVDRIPQSLLEDYASYLTWGRCYNGALDPDFFYPNQDWEPPVWMVPVIQAPVGSFDRTISSNSMRPTTPPWSQAKELAPTVYPAVEPEAGKKRRSPVDTELWDQIYPSTSTFRGK